MTEIAATVRKRARGACDRHGPHVYGEVREGGAELPGPGHLPDHRFQEPTLAAEVEKILDDPVGECRAAAVGFH